MVTVKDERVLASAGVTESQLPPAAVALVKNETGELADKVTVLVIGVVEPTVALAVTGEGLGVIVGGAEPVATICPPVRPNTPCATCAPLLFVRVKLTVAELRDAGGIVDATTELRLPSGMEAVALRVAV